VSAQRRAVVARGLGLTERAAALQRQLGLFRSECLDEISPTDDADDPPVPHDRYTLYSMRDQQSRDLADVRLLADGNDRPHHNIAGKAIGKTQTLKEVGMKRFPLGEQI
jgi:hypothetical protein